MFWQVGPWKGSCADCGFNAYDLLVQDVNAPDDYISELAMKSYDVSTYVASLDDDQFLATEFIGCGCDDDTVCQDCLGDVLTDQQIIKELSTVTVQPNTSRNDDAPVQHATSVQPYE